MTQEQCNNCACVENLKLDYFTITNKTCKQAAEEIYKDNPNAICEDFKYKYVI